MMAVIPLVSLTDRRPARRIFLASSALSALCCFGIALCDGLFPALGLRAVAGIALAGMYMPGCRRSRKVSRARCAHALQRGIRVRLPSEHHFHSSSAGSEHSSAGAAHLFLPASSVPRVSSSRGPHCREPIIHRLPMRSCARSSISGRFNNRDVLVLIFGYAAAIWGAAGLRQWIVVFLAFCAANQAVVPAQTSIILAIGALISFLGVPAGLLGNELSIRYGLRNIATACFRAVGTRRRPLRLHGDAALYRHLDAWLSSLALLCRATTPISLRVSSPSPPRGIEAQRSAFIPASGLAPGSSVPSYSASRSINSAGQSSSPPGS